MEFDFKMIFRQLGLGDPTAQPQRGTGGYLHKMFRVETSSGKYAVKLRNTGKSLLTGKCFQEPDISGSTGWSTIQNAPCGSNAGMKKSRGWACWRLRRRYGGSPIIEAPERRYFRYLDKGLYQLFSYSSQGTI